MLFDLAILICLIVAGWLLIRGAVFSIKYLVYKARGNRSPVFPLPSECCRCDQPLPYFSNLMSFRHVVLGGWACPSCGSEFDQLGNVKKARAWGANIRDLKKRRGTRKVRRVEDEQKSPIERVFEE